MTIQQIGYFIKLAEELNYTSVAKTFFITQPTLSKQIVNLENEMQVTLFNRSRNGVELTTAGRMFYEKIKPIFSDFMDVIRETQAYADERDNLVIGIQEEQIMSNSFTLAINMLRHENPGLRISIHRESAEELIEGLDIGRFDIINIMALPTFTFAEKYDFSELENESTCLAYAKRNMKLKDEISTEELGNVLAKEELLLPFILGDIDDFQARKMLITNMPGIGEKAISIKVIQSGRPISLPAQISSGLGVSLCNETNFFAIDPQIRLAKVLGTEGSFIKGILYYKQPQSPYIKELVKKTMEIKKNSVE